MNRRASRRRKPGFDCQLDLHYNASEQMEHPFIYQTDNRYFAQVARNQEEPAAEELRELGAVGLEIQKAGIRFQADLTAVLRITYTSRLISRILAPLVSFSCQTPEDLYRKTLNVEWEQLFTPQLTFAVYAVLVDSPLTHSQYAALKVKDAIADRFRQQTGIRPSVDRESPQVIIHLLVRGRDALLSLDLSGGPLHKRGYRLDGGLAPLQETLAATIVRLSGWQGENPLFDPLCGSGTILAEALMAVAKIPAGILRPLFGFQNLPEFPPETWQEVKEAASAMIQAPADGLLSGSDLHLAAVRAARANLCRLPYGRHVRVEKLDFRDHPGQKNGTIITNLPYGVRIGDRENLKTLYGEFGDFLKQRCPGSTAWILTGNTDLISDIGLKPAQRIPLYNGPIECRLLKIECY